MITVTRNLAAGTVSEHARGPKPELEKWVADYLERYCPAGYDTTADQIRLYDDGQYHVTVSRQASCE